jgi:hypothetical protein
MSATMRSTISSFPASSHSPSDNIASRRVAEKNGMTPEKETVFPGFPTIVFSLHPTQRNGA